MKIVGFLFKYGVSLAAILVFVIGMNFMAGVLYKTSKAPEAAKTASGSAGAKAEKKTASEKAAKPAKEVKVAEAAPAAAPVVKKRKVSAKRLYRVCSACHERPGRRNKPDKPAIQEYPSLYGQDAKYIENQVKDILSGKREGGIDANGNKRTAPMKGSLVTPDGKLRISPADIKVIAKWLSAKKPLEVAASAAPVSAELVEQGRAVYKKKNCRACHGKAGNKPLKGYPYLAGQKQAYLEAQILDIKSKARTNGKVKAMFPFVKKLSDDDIKAIAAYLSQEKRS